MNVKEFILEFGDKAKGFIEEYEKFSELSGEQKKDRVVELLNMWFEIALSKLQINAVLKAIVKFILPKLLPELVQVAFNLIQTNIKGITK